MTQEMQQSEAKAVDGQIVAGGMQALATEIRSQREMALSHPRDEKKVMDGAIAELNLVPQFASKAYYIVPYKDYSGGQEKIVNVEGPSVKAARALLRRWGNGAVASRVTAEDDDRFQVEGIFIDFETNSIFRKTVSVSKSYISRKTKIKTPLRDDKLTQALQAGMSKAERNAILSGLPVWLVEAYYAEAKRLAAGGKAAGSKQEAKPIKERYANMLAKFATYNVPQPAVEAFIQEQLGGESDADAMAHMIGVYNAITDGQTTADAVFGAYMPKIQESGKTAGNGAVQGDMLSKGGKL